MRIWCRRFFLCVQFMTRIPIPVAIQADARDFGRCMLFFPLIGALTGLAMWGGWWLGALTMVPVIPVFGALLAQVLFTGALHLDGLADTWDGIASNRDRARMLDIMRDSRIGVNGALALVADLVLKGILLSALAGPNANVSWHMLIYLIIIPLCGRISIVCSAASAGYARSTGLGKHFIDEVTWLFAILALALGMGIIYLATSVLWVLCLAPAAALTGILFALWMRYKIGGVTGDTLGAANELGELITMALILWLR